MSGRLSSEDVKIYLNPENVFERHFSWTFCFFFILSSRSCRSVCAVFLLWKRSLPNFTLTVVPTR